LQLNITNPYQERIEYKVSSDIEELQLPPDVVMEGKENMVFNFIVGKIINPPIIGYIKFVD